MIHILNTNLEIKLKSLCGLHGETAYDPTKSDCKDCLERFNKLYPGSFEAWVKRSKAGEKSNVA